MILDEYRIAPMKTGGGWNYSVRPNHGATHIVSGFATEAEAWRAAAAHYSERMTSESPEARSDPAFAPEWGRPHYENEAMARFRAA